MTYRFYMLLSVIGMGCSTSTVASTTNTESGSALNEFDTIHRSCGEIGAELGLSNLMCDQDGTKNVCYNAAVQVHTNDCLICCGTPHDISSTQNYQEQGAVQIQPNWDNWGQTQGQETLQGGVQEQISPVVSPPWLPGTLMDVTQGPHSSQWYNVVDGGNAIDYQSADKNNLYVPVVAVADGLVRGAGTEGGTGSSYIWISHDQLGVDSIYLHSSIVVSAGNHVKRGDIIGYQDRIGRLVTGIHLHFAFQTQCGSFMCPSVPITDVAPGGF